MKLAQELRQRAPALTETYVAYGVCEALVKECARVADYTIPQANEKGLGQIPRNDKGEDVGVGKGWWYERTYLPTLTPLHQPWPPESIPTASVTYLPTLAD